jgi:hypothetical protein
MEPTLQEETMTTNTDPTRGEGISREASTTKNRCDGWCGSTFTTSALLSDHQRLHAATSAAEETAILEGQGERRP